MRRFFVSTILVAVLIAGATLAGAPAYGGESTGVEKDSIKLGVTYVDLTNTGIDIELGDWQAMYELVIADLNDKGGVNNREIVPVFAPVEPIGTVPAEEACVRLTEDEQVFAVTGFMLADAPLCYVEQHGTPVVNGTVTIEGLERATAPWFSLEPGDLDFAQGIEALAADGAFKGKKLGIVVDVQSQNTFDNVVAPALKRNKVKGTIANITATQGDDVATEQQSAVIAERFESEGINKVLFVGTSAVQFGNALAKTDYRPRMIVVSYAVLRAYVLNAGSALEVVEDAITAAPQVDFEDPALQECFALVTDELGYEIKEEVGPDEPDYRSSAQIACRSIALFAAIADAAGKNLTVESFGKAVRKGPLEIPGSGSVTFNKKTGVFDQPVFIYRFDPDTQTLVADDEPSA